VTVLQRI